MVGMKNQTLKLEKDGESSPFPASCKDFILIFSTLEGLEGQKSGRSPVWKSDRFIFYFILSG
jgi:hypothetical protein